MTALTIFVGVVALIVGTVSMVIYIGTWREWKRYRKMMDKWL